MTEPNNQMPPNSAAPPSPELYDEALALAGKAEAQGDVPVGAVVMHEGKVIGRGFNRREADQNPTSHAEIEAIREAAQAIGSWRLIDCDLIVTLEPCPMCLAASQQARLRKVIYGAEDPKGGALSLGYRLHEDARTNHRFTVEYVKDERCSRVLKDFFKRRRSENGTSGATE